MDNLRGHEGATLISWLSTLGNYLCVPKGPQCVLEKERKKARVKLCTVETVEWAYCNRYTVLQQLRGTSHEILVLLTSIIS